MITDRQTAFDSKLLNRDVGSGVSFALYHDLSNKFGVKLRSDIMPDETAEEAGRRQSITSVEKVSHLKSLFL